MTFYDIQNIICNEIGFPSIEAFRQIIILSGNTEYTKYSTIELFSIFDNYLLQKTNETVYEWFHKNYKERIVDEKTVQQIDDLFSLKDTTTYPICLTQTEVQPHIIKRILEQDGFIL
jgi:hypothetical protein